MIPPFPIEAKAQASDRESVAAPEGWLPTPPAIVPPPQANTRGDEGFDSTDWYFSTKQVA